MTITLPEGARVLGDDIVNLNVDSSGFYRAQLPAPVLADVIASGPRGLTPIERYSFIDDAWALTVAGRLEAAPFVDLLDGFRDDDDLSVWQRVIGALDTLWRVVSPSDRPRFQQRIDSIVRPAYEAMAKRPLRRRSVSTAAGDVVRRARAPRR